MGISCPFNGCILHIYTVQGLNWTEYWIIYTVLPYQWNERLFNGVERCTGINSVKKNTTENRPELKDCTDPETLKGRLNERHLFYMTMHWMHFTGSSIATQLSHWGKITLQHGMSLRGCCVCMCSCCTLKQSSCTNFCSTTNLWWKKNLKNKKRKTKSGHTTTDRHY